MVRKVSAVVFSLFVMVGAVALLAPAAGAQAYPPVTTTTTPPPTTTPPTTQPSQPTTTTTGTSGTTAATTPPVTGKAAALAFTGSDSKPLVILGVIAVFLGAVLVVAARRRSSVRAPRA